MVNKRISALNDAEALADADLLPVSQGSTSADTGVTRKATLGDLVAFAQVTPWPSANVDATGTTSGTAVALTAIVNNIVATTGATGVMLQAVSSATGGEFVVVFNVGDDTLVVYANTGDEIWEAGSTSSSATFAPGYGGLLVAGAAQWYLFRSV